MIRWPNCPGQDHPKKDNFQMWHVVQSNPCIRLEASNGLGTGNHSAPQATLCNFPPTLKWKGKRGKNQKDPPSCPPLSERVRGSFQLLKNYFQEAELWVGLLRDQVSTRLQGRLKEIASSSVSLLLGGGRESSPFINNWLDPAATKQSDSLYLLWFDPINHTS